MRQLIFTLFAIVVLAMTLNFAEAAQDGEKGKPKPDETTVGKERAEDVKEREARCKKKMKEAKGNKADEKKARSDPDCATPKKKSKDKEKSKKSKDEKDPKDEKKSKKEKKSKEGKKKK